MAKFNTDVDFDDFINDLSSLDIAMFAPVALEEAAPIVKSKMEQLSEQHSRTGSMRKSIRAKKPTKKRDRYTLFVGPHGVDKKGVRQMEKMAYLEYGVKSHNQPATPIITPTILQTRDKVCDSIQETFNKYLTSIDL